MKVIDLKKGTNHLLLRISDSYKHHRVFGAALAMGDDVEKYLKANQQKPK